MKKWLKFFFLSFFAHKTSKEGVRRSYSNVFLGFLLALIFLWVGFVGADMLPFAAHYNNSPDFVATVRSVFANPDHNKRIDVTIENNFIKLKQNGGEYTEGVLVNTFENEADRRNYSINGYNVVLDSRSANTLAEFEAYCVSNDGKNTIISYEEYLTLSDVAKLNFDFKLRYTGNALELNDELAEDYRAYVANTSDENKLATENLASELAENKITKNEYNRAIYELYFSNYYPEITAYESTSKVPLLRNYYYHQYIINGSKNYLFVFDDCITGSFETKGGIDISFYGFYSNMENGTLIVDTNKQGEANKLADNFIKNSFNAVWVLNVYAYAMNIFSLIPFIALMIMVATLLSYSIMRLRSVETTITLGGMFKIVGSFIWFSGIISAVVTVIMAFFVQRNILGVMPLVLFFVVLVARSMVFAIKESKLYIKQLEQQESEGEA